MRRALAALGAASLLLAVLPACTTSRAVRRWHEADAAIGRGDRALAILRYEEAYGRDGKLVGAEVNRIALLARDPAAARQVRAAHEALAEKKSGVIEVELLGAGLDLIGGEAKLAWTRLEAIAEAPLAKADRVYGPADAPCNPLRREVLRLRLETALVLGMTAPAGQVAAELHRRCAAVGPGLRGREALLIGSAAIGAGDAALARAVVGSLDAGDPAGRRLAASLALRAGEGKQALALLEGLDDGPAAMLRAAAQLQLGRGADALAALDRARSANVDERQIAPLEASAALLTGDVRRARDVLAGLLAQARGALPWTLAFDLGLAELRLGDLQAAAQAFARAARACPDCSAPKQNLLALRSLGIQTGD